MKSIRSLASSIALALIIIGSLYRAATIALVRPLWHDEIFTLASAKLPDLNSLREFLLTGAESHPILFLLINSICLNLFPDNEQLAIRLISVFGFGLAQLCIFLIASRFMSTRLALTAAIFPVMTFAYAFSYDARGYAIMLGLVSLTYLIWLQFGEDKGVGRFLVSLGLFFGIFLSCSLHFLAIVAFVPLGVAELLLTLKFRRLRFVVAIPTAVAGAVWYWLNSFQLDAMGALKEHFWAPAKITAIPQFYEVMFGDQLFYSVFPVIVLVGACLVFERGNAVAALSAKSRTELIGILSLALLPIFVVVFGIVTSGGFHPRYAICAVIGFAVLVPYVMSIVGGGSWRIESLLLVIAVLFFLKILFWDSPRLANPNQISELANQTVALAKSCPFTTVVYSDGRDYLEVEHYTPQELKFRMAYLTDRASSIQHIDELSLEFNYENISLIHTINLIRFEEFLSKGEPFCVYGDRRWLIPELLERKAEISVLNSVDGQYLYKVKPATAVN